MTITTADPAASPTRAMDAAFAGERCEVVHDDGTSRELAVQQWSGEPDEADHALFLRLCTGRTLDVGCGPGRLTAALTPRVPAALGIDVSHEAIRQARARGARAVRKSVFDRLLPDAGSWDHVLLADGNIGIGGDPVRILRRTAQLARAGGRVLAEVDPSHTGLVRHRLRLRIGSQLSEPFWWAVVGADVIGAVASQAGLCVESLTHTAGRCVASLSAPVLWD